ncbi:hypothetical protein KUL25_04225 [Rhodobacteraceae bacterium N5(2021)]|uniref:Uncharacterized protein n=1 Tax=Gymnodinialimonas phycosphaerae TaxID=2841589 RepID=A0A975YGQ1_9RHOB|nr:hypothetical protein [Gymnodinialimonas phycosphaerae]MBY4891968.1 hypothetical protein [Gymnodinialimonas phycosphaerae]
MSANTQMKSDATAITREGLSAFRSHHPDCVLALWTDIEARLVLFVDSDLRHPQEGLDALGSIASCVLGGAPETAPDSAVFVEPTGNSLFLRDKTQATHALVCTSGPGLDPNDLLLAMTEFMSSPAAMDVAQ